MANEITVTTSLGVVKGVVNESLSDAATTFDQTGTRFFKGVQAVGTAEEALDMGDLTDPGWCYMKNMDSANFVSVRAANGETEFIRLLAGEHMAFRMVATAPTVQADTAEVDLQYMLVQL